MLSKPTLFLESHHLKNPFFGFGQFNYHLLKALHSQEISDLEITLHTANMAKWEKEFGSSYHYKKYNSLSRYPLARIRKKYDLWHAMNQNTKIEPYYDIPYVLTVHNITYIKNPDSYMEEKVHQRFQEKLNRSHAITYISEHAKSSTHQFFNVPTVPEYVIYNGNPITEITITDTYKPKKAIQPPFLFSIGEFTARKNFKSLIHMLNHIPGMNLVIAGKNSTQEAQEIRELIKNKNLTHRVFLPGKVSEQDKQWYYQNCQAFVFPSLREGFGLPIIEAMRFGKPIFTSNNTSLPEIGGDIAQYWNHYDSEYMAKKVKQGLEDLQNNSDHFKTKAIARASSFNWNQAATSYLNVYNKVLTQKSHGK